MKNCFSLRLRPAASSLHSLAHSAHTDLLLIMLLNSDSYVVWMPPHDDHTALTHIAHPIWGKLHKWSTKIDANTTTQRDDSTVLAVGTRMYERLSAQAPACATHTFFIFSFEILFSIQNNFQVDRDKSHFPFSFFSLSLALYSGPLRLRFDGMKENALRACEWWRCACVCHSVCALNTLTHTRTCTTHMQRHKCLIFLCVLFRPQGIFAFC